MSEINTSTLKYFWLAIHKYLPLLKDLKYKVTNKEIEGEIDELIEIFEDIENKIGWLHLNFEDPNKFYDGEEDEYQIDIPTEIIEDLSGLVNRMLLDWQERIQHLQGKKYLTEKYKDELNRLKNLERPLSVQMQNMSSYIGMYAKNGPLEFPGENSADNHEEEIESHNINPVVFPASLMQNLPKDVTVLCEEFNFNFKNQKPNACILLLRRLLPLSIVRKFQQLDEESDIKNEDGEFLDTKALLGKVQAKISNKRVYREVSDYKVLVDSSQHSYALNVDISDVQGAAVKIRVFLGELF